MKIKTDEEIYVLPCEKGAHILAENEYIEPVIECLESYFGQKKKTKCIILDDEEDAIDMKNTNFIYIPSSTDLNSVFDFKPKTELNNELTEFIDQNNELFQSVDRIRKDLEELLTDSGIYRFKEVLVNNLDIQLKIDMLNFDVSKILQLLRVSTDFLTQEEKILMLYNLMLYVNKDKFNIIYMDYDLSNKSYNWINRNNNNELLILVNNKGIHKPISANFNSIIIMREGMNIMQSEIDKSKIELISYLLHPIIKENMELQTEKNIELFHLINSENSTFFLRFADPNTL